MRRALMLIRFLHHFAKVVRDPSKLDDILAFVAGFEEPEFIAPMTEHFARSPRAAIALQSRPRVGLIDLDALAQLPEGTLGHAFATHMRESGLDPSAIPVLPANDQVSYTFAHLHEVHDIWHVVTGFGTDTAGELGLQAFNAAQFPTRLGIALIAGGLLNALLFEWEDRQARMDEISRGWNLGRSTPHLFGVDWARHWAAPLEALRDRLGVRTSAPDPLFR
ncbi:MAG: ubiquinone biosynthesis protein COQ4 [Cognaticolwellia sp.]|jgi:ubiquinone biosynthesis protein COQ4